MPVWGYGELEPYSERWRTVSVFSVLGHTIQSNGSIHACFSKTISAAWRQFWANIGGSNFRSFQLALKLRRMQSLVFPVINFRVSRWPFTKSKARLLDRIQRKMIGALVHVKKMPSESWETFWRRKNKLVSECIPNKFKGSNIWANRVLDWNPHIVRNTCGGCWSATLVDQLTPEYLADRRTHHQNRPNVRIISGFASVRWYESLVCADAWLSA